MSCKLFYLCSMVH